MKIELLDQMLESAKKNKKGLRLLKEAAVRLQLFEAAAGLREMEREFFPDTPEIKQEKEFAETLKISFSMVGINTDVATCWLIYKTTLEVFKKKGKFSLKDAGIIQTRHTEIFDIDTKNQPN